MDNVSKPSAVSVEWITSLIDGITDRMPPGERAIAEINNVCRIFGCTFAEYAAALKPARHARKAGR